MHSVQHSLSFAPELPFKYVGGDPALDLVNTVDWTEHGLEQDRLPDYERLTRWAEGAGVLSGREAAILRARARAHPQEAETAYRHALEVRRILHRLFTAVAQGNAGKEELDDFNRLLARTVVRMRVAADEATGRRREPRFEIAWREADRLEAVVWPLVWSAAALMLSPDTGRIRVCAGSNCGWIYVDRSRNQLRRWCQMATCGTREKSRRRYRKARRRPGPRQY
jgi:predicted RNA-binding Zn ribbon-like protein